MGAGHWVHAQMSRVYPIGGGGMTEWKIERTPYESEIDIVSDGRVIATVEAGEDKEEIARLIAAAPDMLEALNIAIWIIEKNIHGPVAGYSNILDAVRKARGEE